MLLKSHNSFNSIAEFDPKAGTFSQLSHGVRPEGTELQFSGAFDIIGDAIVVLYRQNDSLILRIDDRDFPFSGVSIELESVGNKRHFRVTDHITVLFERTYQLPILDPPLTADPSPFVEEEDFDFGLLLANLSNDPDRQSRIYKPERF